MLFLYIIVIVLAWTANLGLSTGVQIATTVLAACGIAWSVLKYTIVFFSAASEGEKNV